MEEVGVISSDLTCHPYPEWNRSHGTEPCIMGAPDHQRYSRDEAECLVGRRVRALAPYAYLPAGTMGSVVGTEEVAPDGFELVVEFDVARRVRD